MRLRFARGRDKRGRVLVASPGASEVVNASRVRWLASHGHKNLLPCEYDVSHRCLIYDVHGLTSLRKYVRHTELSHDALVRMLGGITDALAWCMMGGNRCYHVLNDPAYVFVGTTREPHLALVPVEGVARLIEKSPFESLALLSDESQIRYASPDAVELARCLADFVAEQDDAFSINALRHFVERECGI